MRTSNWAALLAISVLIVLGFIIARALYFGSGASAYSPPERELQESDLSVAAVAPRNAAAETVSAEEEGVVVVDFAHNNALFVEELNTLFAKIVSRGFTYELVPAEAEDSDDVPGLLERLEYAKALVLPLPRADFTAEEIGAIERFVEKGGRILIIGDPTRTIAVDGLNSIAGAFNIIYANDYLYSLSQESNDNNYRNVVYRNFNDSPLTADFTADDKVIFYSGGSVMAPGHEIIIGDESTHSSISESDQAVASAALTTNDQVLALSDLTFFGEPYSAAESNGKFINNIANFLTSGERSYELQDFPYLLNNTINVVFKDTLVFNSQFEDSVALKQMLEAQDRSVAFTDNINDSGDVIFVGRYDDADVVQDYLAAAGITILDPQPEDENGATLEADPPADSTDETAQMQPEAPAAAESEGDEGTNADTPKVGDSEMDSEADGDFVEGRVRIQGVGELERGGSTLFHLHQEAGRNVLIILSDNPNTNADAFELLMDNAISDCLVSPNTAVCQTETPDGKLPPSIRSTRIDKILVVSDDDGRARDDDQTSVVEYVNVLSDTYNVSTWVTSDDDSPPLEELQEYDAVIWSTGDYWDDSIDQTDADTLSQYIEAGGNLILAGASIAFDWDHTDFLEDLVHVDYLDFAEQQDIELVLADHPIARDFAEGTVISFTQTPSDEPLLPDVVNHTSDARVIFTRGPESEKSGAASVVAYEDDRSKVAYLAFPIYLLESAPRVTLVNNIVDWFSRKPLDLPNERDYTPYESDGTSQEEDTGEEGATEDGEETPSDGEETGENGDDGENEDSNGDEGEDNGENGDQSDDSGQ